jgi:hypothetical protein
VIEEVDQTLADALLVDWDLHGAPHSECEPRRDELAPVVEHDGHMIAAPDPAPGEAGPYTSGYS